MTDRTPLNEPAELPADLRRWNWGAFLLTWIWGLGNATYIALLALIPGVNVVMMVILGIKGRAWAWRNNRWRDLEHFRRNQRNWAIAGVVVWVGVIVLIAALFFGIQSVMKNNGAFELTMRELNASPAVVAAFGTPVEAGFFVSGSIETGGTSGKANLSVPISGPKAAGVAVAEAVVEVGRWKLLYLATRVEGADEVITVVARE